MMFHSNTRAWLALQSKDDKNVVKGGSPFTHWVKITGKYDMVIFWLYLPPAQTSCSSRIYRVDHDTWWPKILRWLQTLHRRSLLAIWRLSVNIFKFSNHLHAERVLRRCPPPNPLTKTYLLLLYLVENFSTSSEWSLKLRTHSDSLRLVLLQQWLDWTESGL